MAVFIRSGNCHYPKRLESENGLKLFLSIFVEGTAIRKAKQKVIKPLKVALHGRRYKHNALARGMSFQWLNDGR